MKLLAGLNKAQKKAVLHSKGPLLVIAGAGTGKTKVITHRIAGLIESGVEPDKILAVTFTNKASREMAERVAKMARGFKNKNAPTIATFHSLCANILKKYGVKIGVGPDFSILDERQRLEIIEAAISELGLDSRQFQLNLIQKLISQKKSLPAPACAGGQAGRAGAENIFSEKIQLIYEKYEERLEERRALDFDDLISKTIFLFENFPEILKIYREKWPHIHIDEYQDTDRAQHRLVQLLGGTGGNVCAVGDEDQSIYGFRGADFTNILEFEKTWPSAKIITLERNYRSSQKILDAANAAIAKNKARRPKNLFTRKAKGGKLSAFAAENEKEEAERVAEIIKKILKKGSSSGPIAILCRANFQFHPFEKALKERGLPYLAAADQDDLMANGRPIRLMTVHAAKGLEFEYVFIPGLEKGLFPHSPTEEERRLFYVALTRGKKKIFLSWCRFRTSFGLKQINQPSPFLSDIPKNLIKWLL